MCGIFAYIGKDKNSVKKIVCGLKDLEYRGYDSWGVATQTTKSLLHKKQIGKISEVNGDIFLRMEGCASIGHTRWATNGRVSKKNAHPHFNSDRTIAVVHNGIIENYGKLRDEITKIYGYNVFRSDTDSETIPHLIDIFIRRGLSLEKAFLKASKKLKGRFAFVVLSKHEPFLLAARSGSPLVVGKGEGDYFLASDVPAFLTYTKTVNYINDGEWAKVSKDGVTYGNFRNGKKIKKRDEQSKWSKESATKGGCKHFMLKEIKEQGETISRVLSLDDAFLRTATRSIAKSPDVSLVACGTAHHVGMLGEYIFSNIAKKKVQAVYAAEFHNHIQFLTKESVVIPITQSGETADVLEAVSLAKKNKATVISILNVRGSSVERESDFFLPINAGPEIAVASTKAATGQMVTLYLLAYVLGKKEKSGRELLGKDIKSIDEWLHDSKVFSRIRKIAQKISVKNDLYVIGKNELYPVALEAALKIKEVSYIHAEGFAASELKHGAIALIEKGTPVVSLVGNDMFRRDVLSNAEETKIRGALIIGVSPEKDTLFDYYISVPKLEVLAPVAHTIATQILAYYLSVLRGHNPDKPRNLAKSVTVK